jgi:hypothetical protein
MERGAWGAAPKKAPWWCVAPRESLKADDFSWRRKSSRVKSRDMVDGTGTGSASLASKCRVSRMWEIPGRLEVTLTTSGSEFVRFPDVGGTASSDVALGSKMG